MDLRRLRLQEWAAGACGAALIASTFLHWYRVGPERRDAWQALGALDVALALVALMAIAVAVVTAAHRSQAVPTALEALLVLLGLIATVWLIVRVVSPPGWTPQHGPRATGYRPGTDVLAGAFVGLVSCLGLTLAAMAGIRDDRFPKAVTDAARVDVPTLPAPPREGAGEAG